MEGMTYAGKKRQEAKKIAKSVDKLDSGFATRVNTALTTCKNIMCPFIESKYHGAYSNICIDIATRVGELRNSLAHGKMVFKFDAIHLTDIKVIEELTYALRLQSIGIEDQNIQKGIDHLFGERLVP